MITTKLSPKEVDYILSHQGELASWRRKGYSIITSPPNVLQIDLDDNEMVDVDDVCRRLDLILIDQARTKSKSGGTHLYVKLDQQFSIEEKLRLQVEFGSDPHREYMALLRHRQGIENPIVFIEVDLNKVPRWAIEKVLV